MTFGNKFSKPAAAVTTAQRANSKFAPFKSINSAEYMGRTPMPNPGDYTFTIDGIREGRTGDSIILDLVIDEVHHGDQMAGDRVAAVITFPAKFPEYGFARFKQFCMAGAGYDDESKYNEDFDPELGFLDAQLGIVNDASKPFIDQGMSLVGHKVLGSVRLGKEDGEGGHYREFTWKPVAE